MMLLARIGLIFRRFGLSFVIYACLMVLTASMQKQFVPIDMAIAGALAEHKSPPRLDPRIALVDLGRTAQRSWHATVQFLSIVKKNASYRPQMIVLDAYFSDANDYTEPGISASQVAAALKSVRDAGPKVPIFATVNPYEGTSIDYAPNFGDTKIAPAIYDALTGSGHSEWALVGNLGWYRATLPARADEKLYALPLVVTSDFPIDSERRYLFPIGSSTPVPYTLRRLGREPSALEDKIVIVGNTTNDARFNSKDVKVAGMIYTAWAISERLNAGRTGHVGFFTNPAFVIAIAVILSLCSAVAFRIAFMVEPSLSRKLPMACAAGAVVPVALFLLVVAAFATENLIYARPTSAFASILATTISAWSAGRVQVRYARIIAGFEEGRTKARHRSDVFVSYSRDDENTAWIKEEIVKPLSRTLRADGTRLDVFFDQETIGSGTRWFQTIVEALWGTRFVIAVYTPRYFERPMCSEELMTAMRRAVNDPDFRIFPVSRMAASAIPPEFAGMQIIDARGQPKFIEEIVAAVSAPAKRKTIPTVRYETGEVELHADT